jgi:hypothetical protein
LGKRYVQDRELDWGAAQLRQNDDSEAQCAPATSGEKAKAAS